MMFPMDTSSGAEDCSKDPARFTASISEDLEAPFSEEITSRSTSAVRLATGKDPWICLQATYQSFRSNRSPQTHVRPLANLAWHGSHKHVLLRSFVFLLIHSFVFIFPCVRTTLVLFSFVFRHMCWIDAPPPQFPRELIQCRSCIGCGGHPRGSHTHTGTHPHWHSSTVPPMRPWHRHPLCHGRRKKANPSEEEEETIEGNRGGSMDELDTKRWIEG